MKKYTLAQFKKDAAHLNPVLIAAVVRQAGGWQEFQERAQDIANHGAASGFSGFIYYRETEPFAKRYKTEIFELASQQAQEFGMEPLTMIAGFNCLKSSHYTPGQITRAIYERARTDDEHGDKTQILNALAWYALEEVARALADLQEQNA